MTFKRSIAFLSLPVLALATACAAGGNAPDEFRVVTKAPLITPPEYSLRPPPPNEVRPSEVDPAREEQPLVFGRQLGVQASLSEQVLVARADAISVSPIIRNQIDYEESGVLRKSSSTADRVLNWSGSEEERAQAASDNATGGEDVVIERGSGRRIKLPGT